jgi:hypothetical protein
MLEISQPGSLAFVSSPLRLDERIIDHLMGRDYLDDRIVSVCRPVTFDREHTLLSATQQERVGQAVAQLQAMGAHTHSLVVQMPGDDNATKRLYAAQIADQLDLPVFTLASDQLTQTGDITTFTRLWNRERILQPLSLLVETGESTAGAASPPASLFDGLAGLVFVDSAEPIAGDVTTLVMDTPRPTRLEQWHLWKQVLGSATPEWSDRLAGQFDLNVGDFADAAAVATSGASAGHDVGDRVWDLYRRRGRPRLDGLAQLITSTTTLDDVQLPHDEKRMLVQIHEQTRNRLTVYDRYGFRDRLGRGLGITALFAGESGTGKTMAAEAIANALELDLYRIDLASVVSKYIGETEKNLKRVIDAAQLSGVVLLFDEADAIFGKRTEVHDSHDRYANIEVSYLLQRMESYSGLAILTTNMRNALDHAFLRRLRFVVEFPFPNVAERLKIWEGIFPVQDLSEGVDGVHGVRDLDLAKLARPSLTGGQIRNIALNGAFLAAAADGVITMELLREAARDELRKNGRPYSAGDFADWTSTRPNDLDEREAV